MCLKWPDPKILHLDIIDLKYNSILRSVMIYKNIFIFILAQNTSIFIADVDTFEIPYNHIWYHVLPICASKYKAKGEVSCL